MTTRATLGVLAIALVPALASCHLGSSVEISVTNRGSQQIESLHIAAMGSEAHPLWSADSGPLKAGAVATPKWTAGPAPRSDGEYVLILRRGTHETRYNWGYFTRGLIDLRQVRVVIGEDTIALMAAENQRTNVAFIDVATGRVISAQWFPR